MPRATTAWIAAARARRRLHQRLRPRPPREELVRRHAPGRSFADIGCMWSVDGAISFLAEESGATAVTGLDLMPASAQFEAERARRGSRVRFVQGDLHDEAALGQVGEHDVVWCSGVLYHVPHPLLTLERLRAITREVLLLSLETIPEVPGVEQACVFYPGLSEPSRRAYRAAQPGPDPFDAGRAYGNWWWGITPSALRGMLEATGFEVLETQPSPFHVRVVARPTRG